MKKKVLIATLAVFMSGCASTTPLQSTVESSESRNTNSESIEESISNVLKDEDDSKTIVCKNRRPTGSRIPERECMSKQGWKNIEEASKRVREKLNKPAYNSANTD